MTETTVTQTDNIQIRVIKLSERDEVVDFLRTHFYPDEPLNIAIDQDPLVAEYGIAEIAHGTSFIAVQQQTVNGISSELIVGVLLSAPKYSNEAEHLFKEADRHSSDNWGRLFRIFAQAERDANVFERYNIEKALHVNASGVHRSFRGRGIGTKLKEKLAELGREHNYPLMTTDCASFYSAQLSERMGMECVNVIKYADYLDEEGKVVFKPPPPHEYLKTYAMRL